MKGKKARRTESITIRRKDSRVVEIIFPGIPGDRDLRALEDALDALGYNVSVDLRLPAEVQSDTAEPPTRGGGGMRRRRGTEDMGPAAPDMGPAAPLT